MKILTVVPAPKAEESQAHRVMGTEVLLSDGSRLEGVRRIELVADIERGVWVIRIEAQLMKAPSICAELQDGAASVTNNDGL